MPIQELKTVGDRIRYARKELRKLTQPQLAKAAGVKQPSISELETGETKEISGPLLIGISKALRVRPEWIITGEQPIEPSAESLTDEELEMLIKYRAASPRWRLSLRLLADVQSDDQDEISESVNVLMARIFAKPVADERVEQAYGLPPTRQREPLFRSRDGAASHGTKSKKRYVR